MDQIALKVLRVRAFWGPWGAFRGLWGPLGGPGEALGRSWGCRGGGLGLSGAAQGGLETASGGVHGKILGRLWSCLEVLASPPGGSRCVLGGS